MNGNAVHFSDAESRADGASADGKGWPLARERYRENGDWRTLRARVARITGKQSGTAKFTLRLCVLAGAKFFCFCDDTS